MSQQVYDRSYGGSAPENYERYFVPTIGGPLAEDLLAAAALRPGQRVLDVACGTGVVARGAASRVGAEGFVAGLDVNAEMLRVARSATPEDLSIEWYETTAEAMPLPDDSFDVVLCQMGLQFIPDKASALKEMRRILAPTGRLVLNTPGPAPELFRIMAAGLGEHIHPDCASFPAMVFALHEPEALREMLRAAGFADIDVSVDTVSLPLPAPEEFLWQYVSCTPLAAPVSAATEEQRAAAERDICQRWRGLTPEGAFRLSVGMTTVVARA